MVDYHSSIHRNDLLRFIIHHIVHSSLPNLVKRMFGVWLYISASICRFRIRVYFMSVTSSNEHTASTHSSSDLVPAENFPSMSVDKHFFFLFWAIDNGRSPMNERMSVSERAKIGCGCVSMCARTIVWVKIYIKLKIFFYWYTSIPGAFKRYWRIFSLTNHFIGVRVDVELKLNFHENSKQSHIQFAS